MSSALSLRLSFQRARALRYSSSPSGCSPQSIQRRSSPASSRLRHTGKMRADCRSSLPSISVMSMPHADAHSLKGRPIYNTLSSARGPRNLSLYPYGRTTYSSSPTGTMSTHWPGMSDMLQLFSGTPVMMLLRVTFQSLPTQLFSIHIFWLPPVKLIPIPAFCTNMAGCGFSE